MELDNKATGSSSFFWKGLAEDFRDQTVAVPNLFDHPLVSDWDPNHIVQPNIAESKLYDMWNEAKGKRNPCGANWKGESGNHQPWESFCRGNKDIYMVGAAIEMYPELNEVCRNLLPEDARREFSGTRNTDGTSRDVKPELSDRERRENTKRKGKELYEKTRQRKKKKADNKRTKSIEECTKKSIERALSSLVPHFGASASGSSKWREHTKKLESQAALLDLNAKINEQYKSFSGELERLVEARGEGNGHVSVRETFVSAMVAQLKQRMLKASSVIV